MPKRTADSPFLVTALLLAIFATACAGPRPTAPEQATRPPSSAATPKAASPTPVSFAGKTVTIIVSSAAGGTADITARAYARHLTRFLPGHPIVVVRNMPGGGGTIGANYAYGAKPDGLTLTNVVSSTKLNELLGASAVKYRVAEMPALLGTAGAIVIYVRSGLITRPEDIVKAKGIVFGYMAGTAGTGWVVFRELVEFPVEKSVFAFTGSGDTMRAFLAGEINMTTQDSQTYTSSMLPYVEKGEVAVLAQSGILDEKGELVKDPILPKDMLTAKELYEKVYGKSPSGIKWDAYKRVLADKSFNYILSLPPKTPDDVAQTYWAATEEMIKDATFLKDIQPLVGSGGVWGAGRAYDRAFKASFGMEPEIRDWLRKVLSEKYGILVE